MLRSKMLTALVVVVIAGVGTAATGTPTRAASAPAAAEVYYKCLAGFAFSASGSAAQCKKPAYTDQRSIGGCPIGFPTYRIDRLDRKDMCSGTNPVTGEVLVEPACNVQDISQGYTKRIVTGKDYCGKLIPQQIQAPSVPVSL